MSTSGRDVGRWLAGMALALAVLVSLAGCQTTFQLRREGREAMRAGQYAEARDRFAQAVEQEPTDFHGQYYLGLAHLALGEPGQAEAPLEQALVLRPDDPQWTPRILDRIAESLYQQEREEALHAFLARAVKTYGTTRDYLRQAEYQGKIGDLDGARLTLRKAALFADPADPRPYVAMAAFYESINDLPHAIEALRYAYYIDRENSEVHERLRRLNVTPGPTVAKEPPRADQLMP